MANQFTYSGALETLKDKLQWEVPDSSLTEMEERFRLMGILYFLAATIDHFEKAIKRAEESIIIRELADVDFDYWTNINNWDIPEWLTDEEIRKAHLWQNWCLHNNREYIGSKLSNDMTGLLPEPPKLVEYDDAKARADMRTFLQLFQGVCFNSQQLRYAIYQGIQALIETLQTLHTTLYKPHTDEEYAAWYDELWLEFSSKLVSNITKNYAFAYNHRLNGPNRDWLLERFGDAAIKFWDTPYMQERKDACTNQECKNQTIFFDIPTLSKDQQRKFFHVLLEIGTFDDKGYHIDKRANAGKCLYLLYLENVQEQAILEFFTFLITAQIISSDLIKFPQEKKAMKKKDELKGNTLTKKGKTSVSYTIRYINANEQSRTQRLQLLMRCLQNLKWIEEPKSADDFIDLFDGKPRECNIKWTDTLNQATVYYFLQQLLAQPYIEKVTGCSARSLMMNQFHFSNPRADEKRITTDSKRIINRLLLILNPQKQLPTKTEDFTNDVADMSNTSWNYLEDGLHATKDINSRTK